MESLNGIRIASGESANIQVPMKVNEPEILKRGEVTTRYSSRILNKP